MSIIINKYEIKYASVKDRPQDNERSMICRLEKEKYNKDF